MNFFDKLFSDMLSSYSVKMLQIVISMSTIFSFETYKVPLRNGACGKFDYNFAISEVEYSSSSQMEFLLSSGNFWAWKNCGICPEECKGSLSGLHDMYRLSMTPRNSFGAWMVPTFEKLGITYLNISKRNTDEMSNVYEIVWNNPNTDVILSDIWSVKEVFVESSSSFASYPVIKLHVDGGQGGMLFVPYEAFYN